jgi:quercetin dioxygenase-like cupin family protein
MPDDPVCTDPDKYTVIFENDRVRVLEYRDLPGGRTHPHQHPDSVMITLSRFRRQLEAGQDGREVAMEPGHAFWLPAQVHAGQNIGSTPTHVLFVELKEGQEGQEGRAADRAGRRAARPSVIGPS